MSERSSSQSSSSLSFSADTRKGAVSHRPYPTANPAISIASVPRQRWVPNRGKQTAAPLSSKRGTDERAQCTQFSPQKHRVRALAQTKDAKIVCVIGCQIRGHGSTHSNALLVLAMIRENCTLPECTLQTNSQ